MIMPAIKPLRSPTRRAPGKAGFWLVLAALNLLLPADVNAERALAPVEVRTPCAPSPVVGDDGRTHLAYELHVTNYYGDTGMLRLQRIEVFAGEETTPLTSLTGRDLVQAVQPRTADEDATQVLVAAGMRAVAFLWLTLPDGRQTPRVLRHRLVFADDKGRTSLVDGVSVEVGTTSPLVLGPPLPPGLWLASEGPGNAQSHHWGSLVAVNGQLTIPQRYAIDVFGLDANGRALRGGAVDFSRSRREDWIGYGAQVLAVADGVVRDVHDGAPEHAPLEAQAEPDSLTAQGLYGNYVVLQIAPKVFVHYAHLQPGSVAVTVGQRLHRGQVLGRLGQSGNSNGPHLHFHVSDAATFEGSEGLPFVFDSNRSPGHWSLTQAIDPEARFSRDRIPHSRQMPLDGEVLGF
jgi:hypothetical protein